MTPRLHLLAQPARRRRGDARRALSADRRRTAASACARLRARAREPRGPDTRALPEEAQAVAAPRRRSSSRRPRAKRRLSRRLRSSDARPRRTAAPPGRRRTAARARGPRRARRHPVVGLTPNASGSCSSRRVKLPCPPPSPARGRDRHPRVDRRACRVPDAVAIGTIVRRRVRCRRHWCPLAHAGRAGVAATAPAEGPRANAPAARPLEGRGRVLPGHAVTSARWRSRIGRSSPRSRNCGRRNCGRRAEAEREGNGGTGRLVETWVIAKVVDTQRERANAWRSARRTRCRSVVPQPPPRSHRSVEAPRVERSGG